ncbi:MAG: zf-TFIIB domain-containing protein [bacterium]
MNCVACHEPMIVLELDQVEIDYCLACSGIWLDSGELAILLGQPDHVDAILHSLDAGLQKRKSKRKCPICLKRMEEFTPASASDLYIDRCRKEHGLWFDRGELEQVLQLFKTEKSKLVQALLNSMFNR